MIKKENIGYIIEDSLIDYARIVADNGNRPFHMNDKMGWVRTYPTVWSNFIFYSNFEADEIEDQVTRVCSKIKSGELPNEWLIGPRTRPLDLGTYLEKHNFAIRYDMSGMAIDTGTIPIKVPVPMGVTIKVADNEPMIKLWADTVSNALWNGNAFEACLFERMIHDPDYRFYLAFLDGKAIASSMVLLSNHIATIDMVATLPEYRKMGIGTAMVIAPLLYAKEKGYELGVLQASQAGEPVYRKIGFEEYCRFVVYKYQDE
jgi:GNAT superfamily N-acetyltransferase